VKALVKESSLDNQQKSTSQSKPQLSPYQEGVRKALAKSGEQHTLEAISQGVTPQHIEQQAGLSQQQLLDQIVSLAQSQVPSTKQGGGAMSQVAPNGVLGGLLNMLQGGQFNAPKTEPLGINNAIQLQGALQSGQKAGMDAQKFPLEMQTLQQQAKKAPLETKKLEQETDPAFQDRKLMREERIKANTKLGIEEKQAQNKYFTEILQQKEMTPEANRMVGFLDSGISSLQQLQEIFDADPEQLAQLNVPGNPLGQKLATLRGELNNSILRKDSGASITKQDEELIRKFTVPTGFRAALTDTSVNKMRIQRMADNLQKQRNRALPNEGTRNFVKEALKSGASRDEVYKFLREKGDA